MTLRSLTWNIEGLKRNFSNLKHFCDILNPDIIFLSETQIFNCDLTLITPFFNGEYSLFLNSDECENEESALESSKSYGGTMIMVHAHLLPYATILPSQTSSFLAVLIDVPGFTKSIHIAIYLPTAGKDTEFPQHLRMTHK